MTGFHLEGRKERRKDGNKKVDVKEGRKEQTKEGTKEHRKEERKEERKEGPQCVLGVGVVLGAFRSERAARAHALLVAKKKKNLKYTN